MATTVRELLTKWGFDVDDKKLVKMDQQIQKTKKSAAQLGEAFGRVGQKIAGIGKMATMAITLPIIGAAAGFIKLASDAEETASKFKAVFGGLEESTKPIYDAQLKWIDMMHDKFGRSRTDLMNWSASVQDTFVPMGFARESAMKMSQQVTQLAMDLASFYNNMSESDALQSIQSTLVGNTESARKFGVIITEVTLKQELLAMKAKKVNGVYSEQQKMLARLNLFMKGSKDAQGDAERTAAGFANQMRRLTSMSKEAGETLGKALLPTALRIVEVLGRLIEKFGKLDDSTRRTIILVAGIAAAMGPLLIITGTVISSVGKIIAFIGVLKKAVIAYRAMGAAALWAQIQMFLIPIAIIAIIAVIGYLIYRYWDKIKPFFIKIGKWFSSTFSKVKDFVVKNWKVLLIATTGPLGLLIIFAVKYWSTLKKIGGAAWSGIKRAFSIMRAYIGIVARVTFVILTWPILIMVHLVRKNWKAIKAGTIAAIAWLSEVGAIILSVLRGPLLLVIDAMKAVVAWFEKVITALRERLGPVGELIESLLSKIRDKFNSFYSMLPVGVRDFIGWLAGGGTNATITMKHVTEPGAGIGGAAPSPTVEDKSTATTAAMGGNVKIENKVNVTQKIDARGMDPEVVGKKAGAGVKRAMDDSKKEKEKDTARASQ
ncbi:MAG: hypothetical protein M0Q12_00080 [Synergistaceae bacterium]|jgi:hypothetical protein|nr:hypothetical protein [Synergistaceae bacterium]